MRVISAETKDGQPVSQEQYERDWIILENKFGDASLVDPMFAVFGGMITLDNGNKYQVCG